MKINKIVILLEPESEDEQQHATVIEYKDNMWESNGPVFSRLTGALNEIYKLIKGIK